MVVLGGGALSYDRGNPVNIAMQSHVRTISNNLLHIQELEIGNCHVLQGLIAPLRIMQRKLGKGRSKQKFTARCVAVYRGTSPIRNCPPLGPYSRTKPRALWWR